MAILKVVGVSPALDGEYELDVNSFTNRELHTIKKLANVRAGELREAMQAGDNDLTVAFAVIVIERTGKIVNPDLIWDADISALQVIRDDADEEDGARPLPSPLPSGKSSSDGDIAEPSALTETSGEASSDSGGKPPDGLSRIGLPGSETPATSDPETLAS